MKRFVAGIVNVDKSLYVVAGGVPASSPQGVTGKATLFNEILTRRAGPLLTLPPLLLFKNLLDDPYRIKRLC